AAARRVVPATSPKRSRRPLSTNAPAAWASSADAKRSSARWTKASKSSTPSRTFIFAKTSPSPDASSHRTHQNPPAVRRRGIFSCIDLGAQCSVLSEFLILDGNANLPVGAFKLIQKREHRIGIRVKAQKT